MEPLNKKTRNILIGVYLLTGVILACLFLINTTRTKKTALRDPTPTFVPTTTPIAKSPYLYVNDFSFDKIDNLLLIQA